MANPVNGKSRFSPVRIAFATLVASVLTFGAMAFTTAQDGTPVSEDSSVASAPIVGMDGTEIGEVSVTSSDGNVLIAITASELEPGVHGVHLHETGVCDPDGETAFESAGGHFNPDSTVHGPGHVTPIPANLEDTSAASPVADVESHAGDLGNITVADDGNVNITLSTDSVSLDPEATNSLLDADGTAFVIHAGADDLQTDPSGESGDRVGCAVIFAPQDGDTPVAATPEA
jgi:Cu-Zn family superoxide dismutase